MKTIEIPINLLKLPSPWYITNDGNRQEYLDALKYDKISIEKAFIVLERSLAVLSKYALPERKYVPEDVSEYWYFTASAIAEKISTLDEFNPIKIKEALQEQKIKSISEEMIEEASKTWIWTTARDLATDSIRWTERALENIEESNLTNDFLLIASRYWQSSIPLWLADKLISRSAMIAGKKAFPLLDEVQQNAHEPSLAETASRYKRLILNRN